MVRTLHRILAGQGVDKDVDTLLDTSDNIFGRSFCALGDGAVSPIISSIKYFEQDYRDYISGVKAPFFTGAAAELAGAH